MFQSDEQSDRSPSIAIWLGLITAAIVVITLVSAVVSGGLSSSGGAHGHAGSHGESAAHAHAGDHHAAAAMGHMDDVLDIPLSGTLLSKVYFDLGSAVLSGEAAREVENVATDLRSQSGRVMLAGFHDLSGTPAFNAELAKNRAKAVREALKAAGVSAERIVLRKPESMTTGGAPEEKRRVELRLVE